MSDSILVSTRKGLFALERSERGWQIARTAFLGDNVTLTIADPRDGTWYAALDLGHFGAKLHRSADQGKTWSECAVPSYAPDDIIYAGDGKEEQPASLKMIWALQPGTAAQKGRLWAGTIPGGLFRSDDHGTTWTLVRELWDQPARREFFGGGYDSPGIHSICVDPRDPDCVRVAISTGGVWRTDDAGKTWAQTAQGMFSVYMPEDRRGDPNVQDVHRMVQCQASPDVFWAQHHNGVFRRTAAGGDWKSLDNVPPSVFGFAVAVHPDDPDTAWFVPAIKDERRFPVDAKLVVSRTRDGGKTFDVLRSGLPQEHAYDLVYRHGLAIDASGQRLVFGSTTGGVWTTDNQGDQWSMLAARLPPIHAVSFA